MRIVKKVGFFIKCFIHFMKEVGMKIFWMVGKKISELTASFEKVLTHYFFNIKLQ